MGRMMNKCTCCGKADEPLYYINVGIRWFNNTDNIQTKIHNHLYFS